MFTLKAYFEAVFQMPLLLSSLSIFLFPLPSCSPAGGPVISAALLCRPVGISPIAAEKRTQLTGSTVGAGGAFLLKV